MTEKLKTLSEIVYLGGPLFTRFQIFLKDWLAAYEDRNLPGDLNVAKFIKHFGELKGEDEK